MTLQQMHYIITVAEAGSLNKAAELLYISQPSLSAAVHDVESEIGITLFHRSGRGMTPTNDGIEFLTYARRIYSQYENLLEKYGGTDGPKKKFGISTQHYSFAVKSFVELVKRFGTSEYEFAIRETRTREVIDDVNTMRSEIGIIYMSRFNSKAVGRLLSERELEFHPLIDCRPYVYISRHHPLASCETIRFGQLADYPCLSFEQGNDSSFYFAEEILSTKEYPRTIKACDRATMLNLMVGLDGYTLCSGIICEELNGSEYIAVPFDSEGDSDDTMRIGYITRKNLIMSSMGEHYIEEMKRYLDAHASRVGGKESF